MTRIGLLLLESSSCQIETPVFKIFDIVSVIQLTNVLRSEFGVMEGMVQGVMGWNTKK